MPPTSKRMSQQNVELAEALEAVCDKLCRYPEICGDSTELEYHCDSCPLGRITELFDEARGKLEC